MPTKFIQLTDNHLSGVHGFFYENFCKAAQAINARQPDLVINTGDVSVAGVDRREDLEFARACHDLIDAPIHFLPGNHDMGEIPDDSKKGPPVTKERLDRFKELFPADRWTIEIENWLLIGLNSQLINTNLEEEGEQLEWLTELLATAEKQVGIFIHRPLWLVNPRTREPIEFSDPPSWRDQLIMLMKAHPPRFMATGHLHSYRTLEVEPMLYHFCPSTAYRSNLQIDGWDARLGFMEYVFDGDDYVASPVFPTELEQHDLVQVKGGNRKMKLKHVPASPPVLTAT